MQPGCWRRGGLSGALTGLDAGEIRIRLGRNLTPEDIVLIAEIEAGGLSGAARRQAPSDTAGEDKA